MFLRNASGLLSKVCGVNERVFCKVLTRSLHLPRPIIPWTPPPPIPVDELPMTGIFEPDVCDFISKRSHENKHSKRLAWVTSFDSETPQGIIQLNDYVFGENPRIDILQRVVVWQRAKARLAASERHKSEMPGGGRKPWPQKGLGRARQGSIRAPHFKGGGKAFPKKPRSYDYRLPFKVRMMGIRVALSVRYAQGDLHIVDNFDSVGPHEADLSPILHYRGWNNAVLVDRFENQTLDMASANLKKFLYFTVKI